MKKRVLIFAVVSILVIALVLIAWRIRLIMSQSPSYQQGAGAEHAIELAQVREKDGYYRDAETIYHTIVKDHPDTAEAMVAQKKLVLLYFRMDNYNLASRALGRLIEEYSENSALLDTLHDIVRKYRYGSVEAWYIQQQIQHYANRLEMYKGQLAVIAMNAMILIELQPLDVTAEIDKLVINFSGDHNLPRALWYIAEKYTRMKEFENANGIYQRIVRCYPDTMYAGKAYLDFQKTHILFLIESEQDNKVWAAIDRLCTDFRNSPGLLSALDFIAGKYESLGKYDDTVAIYQRMIKIDPDSDMAAMAQQSIGWTYYARGMYNQAIQEYRKGLKDYPESLHLASSTYWIAQSYRKKREYEQAKEEYQRVISMYPKSREAIYSKQQIALIYSILDMHDEAISEQRGIVNKYPDSGWAPYAQSQVAQSYYSKGEKEQAIKEYQKVIEVYPTSEAADNAEKQIARIKGIRKN